VSKVIWQNAASPTCHPSLVRMDSSDLDPIYLSYIHGSLDPQESAPNGISIGSAVFAWYKYIRVNDTQTDRPRYVQHL